MKQIPGFCIDQDHGTIGGGGGGFINGEGMGVITDGWEGIAEDWPDD